MVVKIRLWGIDVSGYHSTLVCVESDEQQGSGGGSVGRAVASDSRGPLFESSYWQKFILNIYCQLYWKDENKEKEAGNSPFKKTQKQSHGKSTLNLLEINLNSGCGSVVIAVDSDPRGPQFESSHRQTFVYWNYWKDETTNFILTHCAAYRVGSSCCKYRSTVVLHWSYLDVQRAAWCELQVASSTESNPYKLTDLSQLVYFIPSSTFTHCRDVAIDIKVTFTLS